ncbi:Suf domain-containing protein, partial [Cephalotus follicularis]
KMASSFDNNNTNSNMYSNPESAEILARNALKLGITQATPIYEQLLAVYPTSAKYWKQYVDAQMAVNNYDAVRNIFSRCLFNCLHIPLWRSYIHFIKRVNENKGVAALDDTKTAFEFALNNVGDDIASGPLWVDFVSFLKSLPSGNPRDESQRMNSLRKAYQKAIVTPNNCADQLWREYECFENGVSRQLAKGLLSDYQGKFNSAKAVYRERKKYVDEIDWGMLAVVPTWSGTNKEESQWLAWKRFLGFEKGNPQRIDSDLFKKRVAFTYEQCLMYLCHYPDIWYDYAMWRVKSGDVDAAVKVFERGLKVIPSSEILKYAYAEMEESRGMVKNAKRIYEGILGDGDDASTGLARIQFIRFLRRTEGVEAARKYFVEASKSPDCTYQVYVAYAMLAFCLDKDQKVARNVFEAGFKRFMNEPVYVLAYVDFLYTLNDDNNIRALFERALSSLPPENSVEVWERFVQFEQSFGDLASMLKVEQRRKEALARIGEDGASILEDSLQDVVSRYTFRDLLPCSTKDLDLLARQDCLAKNISKKAEKGPLGMTNDSAVSANVNYPDTSRMVVYDPIQKPETGSTPSTIAPGVQVASNTLPNLVTDTVDDILKATPALVAFLANLPAVEGPRPDVDVVISILLQSDIPIKQMGKSGTPLSQLLTAPAPSTSNLSNSSKSHGSSFQPSRGRQSRKRKDIDSQDEDETVQRQPPPQDAFQMRHNMKAQKARVGTTSQSGSVSYGSARSGDLSVTSS